jgi:hypothetical protein
MLMVATLTGQGKLAMVGMILGDGNGEVIFLEA